MLRQAPPLPFLPADVHGKEVVAFAIFYAGDATKGDGVRQLRWELKAMSGE